MNGIDSQFRKYIENKRVVFVGACPNLIGRKFGKRIDEYDIVIRSNHFWKPFLDNTDADYGSRCDVVYINNQYHRETQPFPISEMKIRGISWACFKGLNRVLLNRYNKVLCARGYTNVIREVSNKVRSGAAGLYLTVDILNQSPKEFYMTGVDFFASRKPKFEYNNYQEYLPGYLPDNIREQGNRINEGKMKDGHDFYENARYFYSLFKTHPNFKTDDFILDLLYGIVGGKIKQGEIKWN